MCSDKMSEKPKYLIFRYLITFIIFIMLTTTNINLEKEKQARIFDQEFYPQADARLFASLTATWKVQMLKRGYLEY